MKKVVTVIFSVIIIGITVIGCGFSKFEAETTGEEQHTATMWDVKKETYAHFVNNLIECVIK